MANSELILYPSNWLYNAGIVGLSRVLDSNEDSSTQRLSKDGAIDGEDLSAVLRDKLTDPANDLPAPLENLPAWHWHFLSESFKWNYGSTDDFVARVFQRASKVPNRTQLKKQLQVGELENINFDELNSSVEEAFAQCFGRNPVLTLSQAAGRVALSVNLQRSAYVYRKSIGFLFSKGGPLQNQYNIGWFSDIQRFADFFSPQTVLRTEGSGTKCAFCTSERFQTEPVDARMMTFLFPVYSAFPNAYWANNNQIATSICSFCKFVLLHYHLGFSKLADGTWMFVNAPSFAVMQQLNKLLRQTLTGSTAIDSKRIRELLATSVIELSTKMQTTLGIWTGMNIEVITKRDAQVEYFSLPYEVVKLISNRQVSALLSDIGEFRLLNLVLNEEYSRLMEVGYRLLRESISDRRNYDYINDWLYLDRNRRNLSETANKIFKLYTLIEQRRRNAYAN